MNEDLQPEGHCVGSYQVSRMDRPDAELARLERQAKVALPIELARLRALNLPADAWIADVGCGPGFLSQALAGLVPRGRVLGVDADLELVRQARRRQVQAGLDNLRFVQGRADALPIETASVRLAYARFLLQHLPRPAEILREMRRVVEPGGLVMVVDTDDGGLLLHPEPAGLPELLAASARAQARLGGDRQVGRKLRALMLESGLRRVQVEVVPFTSEMVGMRSFLDICLGFKGAIIRDEDLDPVLRKRVLAEAFALVDRPAAFGQALAYVAVGEVPHR